MIARPTWAAPVLAAVMLCLSGGTTRADPGRVLALPAKRWSPTVRKNPSPATTTTTTTTPTAATRTPADPAAPAFTDADFNACHKLPQGKPVVPVHLKPDTDVDHLIVWLSSVTCKAFVYSGALTEHNRNVTFVVPAQVTPAEAYRLVLNALNSVGLTLQPAGGYYQIIETQRAHSRSIPLYDYDGHRLPYRRPPAGS